MVVGFEALGVGGILSTAESFKEEGLGHDGYCSREREAEGIMGSEKEIFVFGAGIFNFGIDGSGSGLGKAWNLGEMWWTAQARAFAAFTGGSWEKEFVFER